jgi:hypothetical protein
MTDNQNVTQINKSFYVFPDIHSAIEAMSSDTQLMATLVISGVLEHREKAGGMESVFTFDAAGARSAIGLSKEAFNTAYENLTAVIVEQRADDGSASRFILVAAPLMEEIDDKSGLVSFSLFVSEILIAAATPAIVEVEHQA